MRVKFLADYNPRQMADSANLVDHRIAARSLVADSGGKLKSVIVTYGEVDSMQFVAFLPDSRAVFEIAVAIQAAGGSLAEVTVLTPSRTRLTKPRGLGGSHGFEPRTAKRVGFGASAHPLGAVRT